MINKILRYVIWAGLLVIPFIPLFVSSSMYFPFITGKNFAFRIIVGLIFGAWLWLAYRDPSARPKQSGLFWLVVVYFGILTLATIFSVTPLRAFWSNFERMEGLVTYLHLFAYFLVLVSFLKTKQAWSWFAGSAIIASFVVTIYGFVQLAGIAAIHQGSSRLDASLGNSAYLAGYMLFFIFLLGYLFFTNRGRYLWLNYIYIGLAVLDVIILYYTATRGAILGLIGGAILSLILVAVIKTGRARKISLYSLGVLVVLVALFIGLRNSSFIKSSPVLSRFADISLTETTTQSRFLIWSMSLEAAKEHPVLGWGPENYNLVFQKYYKPAMWRQEPWFDRSHNVVLDNLITAGALGLVAYLAMFIFALVAIWKTKRDGEESWHHGTGKVVLTGLLVAYFFHNLFVFDNIISFILLFSFFAYFHVASTEKAVAGSSSSIRSSDDPYEIPVAIVAIILAVFSIYFFSWRGMIISQTLIDALRSSNQATILADFQKIFTYSNTVGLTESREQLLTRAQAIINNASTPAQVKSDFMTLAQAQMAEQLKYETQDARTYYFYGAFWDAVGNSAQALTFLEKAHELSPQKQALAFSLARQYLNLGQTDKAVALLKTAYEADPTYLEAKRIYALISLMTKNYEVADALLSGTDREQLLDDDRFVNYYNGLRNYSKINEIWLIRTKLHPDDKQFRMSLAASYLYIGDREKAIATIEEVVAMDPAFKAQANQIIRDIRAGKIPQ